MVHPTPLRIDPTAAKMIIVPTVLNAPNELVELTRPAGLLIRRPTQMRAEPPMITPIIRSTEPRRRIEDLRGGGAAITVCGM